MKLELKWFCWLGLLLAPVVSSETTWGQLAIRGGKVITMAGDEIESGTILIRDGRIAAVGANLEIPVEYKVIDATGQVVMPGFVDVHSSGGMSQANERNNNVPFLTVLDTIDAESNFFEESRRNGITSAAIVPGNSTMIGGQAAILKTAGTFVHDMSFQNLVGMKFSLQPPSGSRMSHVASLRRELTKARQKKSGEDVSDAATTPTPPPENTNSEPGSRSDAGGPDSGTNNPNAAAPAPAQQQQGLDVLGKALDGEILSYIYCENAMDVGQAIRLIDEFKLKPVLVLGKECDKALDILAERKYPIVLDPELVFWRKDPRTARETRVDLPKAYHSAGLPFMFQADTNPARTTLGSNYLWFQAALAVKSGLSRQQALESCTILPARTLGVDSLVGSIEPGKDADLVILTGDPLATKTWVSRTIIRGEVVYERESDERLRRLLETAEK